MYICTRNYDLKRGGTFETAKAGTFHSVTAGTSIPLFTINLWKKAERNANFKRDLYIVIDFLSKSELEENLMKLRERTDFAKKNETIPMLWLISSLWSSCQELNVRLHVTCRK